MSNTFRSICAGSLFTCLALFVFAAAPSDAFAQCGCSSCGVQTGCGAASCGSSCNAQSCVSAIPIYYQFGVDPWNQPRIYPQAFTPLQPNYYGSSCDCGSRSRCRIGCRVCESKNQQAPIAKTSVAVKNKKAVQVGTKVAKAQK